MIVCFDIGGTAIKGAIATSAQDIRPLPRQPTPLHDFSAFVATMRAVIDQAPEQPSCVALSIAGIIDPDSRRAVVANVPCIHGRLLQDDLETALGLPVKIANDADSFVLAEAGIGAGRGHRVVFGVILGTGVGGGLVIDGKLINSEGGFAGEWGHGPVAATQAGTPPAELPRFRCGCGLDGCIDAVCSARGMEKLHAHLHAKMLTSEEIIADWQRQDPDAVRTIDVYVDILSGPLALVANVTGATIMPVGGGLSNSLELLEAIDHAVRARILRKFARPLVVKAECQIEPGLIGAAILGLGG
ncbi:N-acetylglucosamine kinase [Neorhizobium galegae]|uniref:ROK family protein n=1 Tax=Neorhizobium galegae TaxID=399 RepID=UPI001AE3CFCF|nr:ROK family protein [Neorhizobium galegae]MBP2550828.1 N-acetylglucosamine kinase [Neorhizobium galegae]